MRFGMTAGRLVETTLELDTRVERDKEGVEVELWESQVCADVPGRIENSE